MNRNKVLCLLLLICVFALVFTGCRYDPPEGYSRKLHTYEEIVEYAKKIDPDAEVTNQPKAVKDKYWDYVIYPAVINGINCHVANASDNVYDSNMGEFSRKYYKMDTDYDYYVIRDALKDHPKLGTIEDDSESARFQVNDIIVISLKADTMISQRFDDLFAELENFNKELEKYNLRKKPGLQLSVNGRDYYIKGYSKEEKQRLYDTMVDSGDIN